MISQRFATQIPLEHGKRTKFRVRIVSNECDKSTEQYTIIRNWLLQQISADPTLTACGLGPFETLKMEHNGKCWEITCERISQEEKTV